MFEKNLKKIFLKFIHIFLLIYSFTLPQLASGSTSELRFKTLLNICEAAQSNGDNGTTISIARQLKTLTLNVETDLGKRAIKCMESAFPSDKSLSYEDLMNKITQMQTELKDLCFDLLVLNPAEAISFSPCQEVY
tara:strand:- start:255 stop:659 length:405 start_codon:yes stop_codon:yes gene_type:complete